MRVCEGGSRSLGGENEVRGGRKKADLQIIYADQREADDDGKQDRRFVILHETTNKHLLTGGGHQDECPHPPALTASSRLSGSPP